MGVFRRKLGKIRRIIFYPESEFLLIKPQNRWRDLLKEYQFRTILDIGANDGEFAKNAREIFPHTKIYSFEPIPAVYQKLKEYFIEDKNFVAYNYALGNFSGDSVFYMNEFSPSSSLLEMKEHKEHFDIALEETPISIKLERLDDFDFSEEIKRPLLVKIDVQGYELEVIKGGSEIIKSADAVVTEVSFTELYKDQPLFDEIYEALRSFGFKYAGNIEQLFSPVDGKLLQADAFFIKK